MDVQLADGLPQNSATIIDGMSLVQKLSVGGGQMSFGMVASSLLTKVLHEGCQSNRIDVVFDTYREKSIKNAERTMRGEVAGGLFQETRKQPLRVVGQNATQRKIV